jgi:hypothetical protein
MAFFMFAEGDAEQRIWTSPTRRTSGVERGFMALFAETGDLAFFGTPPCYPIAAS